MSVKEEQQAQEQNEGFWLRELCLQNGFEYCEGDFPMVQSLEMFLHGMPKIPCLQQFPMLTKLCLMGHNIKKLKNIAPLILLEELWVCECKVKQICDLDKLTKLVKLYLYDNDISKIENLHNMNKLEVLWLNHNQIKVIEGINHLKLLTDLNLSENKISWIGNSLARSQALKTLDISGNKLISFKDLTGLRDLPNLRILGLRDPMYEPNPVSMLCNYSTHLLYHLPNLTMLDSYDVSQKTLKDLAESIVVKKKMFYKMRKKVLERKATEICHKLETEKKKLQIKYVEMLRRLSYAVKEIEREIEESEGGSSNSLLVGGDSRDIPDQDNNENAEESESDVDLAYKRPEDLKLKHEALKERILFWETKYRMIEDNYTEAAAQAKLMSEHGSRRLIYEFETGGNVKFEEGTSNDIWYTSCKDLVLARFCAMDYKDYQITGLRIHKIIKVQNRLLKQKFDETHEQAMEQLENVSQNSRKYLDYLFYICKPNTTDSDIDFSLIASEGFRDVSSSQKSTLTGSIAVTNSVSLADKARIKFLSKRSPKNGVDKCAFRYGQLLVCKTFIGKSSQVSSDKKAVQSSYSDCHSVYRPRRHAVCPTRSSRNKSVNSSSSTELCDCTARRCTWYVFDGAMILPEYIVEFEYITKSTPSLLQSLRELILADFEKPVYDRSNSIRSNEAETNSDDENLLNMEPIVRSRPRLTVLSDELLLKQAKVSFMSKIVVLNLNGSGLTRLKPVSSLQNLKTLIVSFNDLVSLQDLSGMTSLESLDASFNNLSTLEGCKGCSQVSYLDVSWNKLHYTREEVGLLRNNFPAVKTLIMTHNPWLKPNSLRLRCIGRLKNLCAFNNKVVTEDETTLALKLATSSRISNSAILAHSTTDSSHPRTLSLTSITKTLMDVSRLKPSRLHEDDKQWFSKVTCLNLDNQHLSKISNLERLCNLRWASFNDNDITKIEGLESCNRLEELSLAGNCITKLDGLVHLNKLKSLDVSNNSLIQIENSYITTLKELRYLSLENNSLTSFKGLQNVTSIHELYVGNNDVTSLREVFYLKGMQGIIILDLHGNPISEGKENYRLFVIYHMFSIKALDGITVDSNEVSLAKDTYGGRLTHDLIAEKLGHSSFSDLTQLDLPNCNLRSIDLGNGDAFPQLRSVNLEHNNLSSFGGLIFLANLRVLCLNHNHIECVITKPKSIAGQLSPQRSNLDIKEDTNQKHIVPVLEKLEVLHLAYNGISSIFALQLERLPGIKALFLQGNNLSKIDGLDGLHQLRELVLDKNKIKAVCETSFINQWKLNELHIEENRLKSLSGLESLVNLRRLYVGINRIQHADIMSFYDVIVFRSRDHVQQDMMELEKLESLSNLIELSVIGNPVSRKMAHRPMLVFRQPHLLSIDGVPVTNEERAKAELYFLEQQGSLQAVQALMGNTDSNLPNYSSSKPQPPLKVTTMPLNGSFLDQYWDIGARFAGLEHLHNAPSPPNYQQEFQEISRGINRNVRRNGNVNSRSNTNVPYIPHGGNIDNYSRKPPKR